MRRELMKLIVKHLIGPAIALSDNPLPVAIPSIMSAIKIPFIYKHLDTVLCPGCKATPSKV
jgi:hypothetical protein